MKNLLLTFVLLFVTSNVYASHDLDSAIRSMESMRYQLDSIARDLDQDYGYDYDVRNAINKIYDAQRSMSDATRSLDYARSRIGRIVVITEEGSGGTTHDDRNAACTRAEERSLGDAQNNCYRQGGSELNHYFGNYRYTREGSGHICRVTATLRCQLR